MRRRLLAPALSLCLAAGGAGLASISAGPAAAAPGAEGAGPPTGRVFVSDLPWTSESNGYGPVERDESNGEAEAGDGTTLRIAGTTFAKGVGMHATGAIALDLAGNCTTFSATVGLDDEVTTGSGTVRFQVYGDGRLLEETGVLTGDDAAGQPLEVDVADVDSLRLVADEATNGKNFDHADWGDALLQCADTAPEPPTTVRTWDLRAPRGASTGARVTLDSRGQVGLDVERGGRTVLTAERLGLRGSDGDLRRGLRFVSQRTRTVSDRYAMLTGKSLRRAFTHTESVLTFVGEDGERIGIAVRVAPDGVAYRYLLPGEEEHRVDAESGRWVLPHDGAAWQQTTYTPNYESEWRTTTASAGNGTGSVGYPALFDQQGTRILLTESDVHGDYAASHLTHAPGSLTYGSDLYRGDPVTSTGPLSTPWRVAIVGDQATVTESTLVDDLATPRLLRGDTSWIHPDVSAWNWLSEGRAGQESEQVQRRYVDLAAKMGWGYTLLDEGWQASWTPRLVRYAHAHGVDVLVWFHSRDLWTQAQRDEWFPRLQKWGVSGVKVDFMDSDDQATHQWYDDIAADSAAHRLMLNFHGASLPTGLQRTWPQIMSYEAVRGAENGLDPERALIVPFTRNVVGSMDWTPTAFSRGTDRASIAHEVAMSTVYESGWQHLTDSPQGYAAVPGATPFLQALPTTWDDSRLLSGTPGRDVVMARRHGDRWFVGGMVAGSGRTLRLPTAGLATGRQPLLVDLLADGDDPSSVAVSTRRVTAGQTLSIDTVTNGGFQAVVCPARGRTTCLDDAPSYPAADLRVTPEDAGEVAPGGSVDLRATLEVATERAQQVRLEPVVPDGWTVQGPPATARRLDRGDTLAGAWTLTAPRGTDGGDTELLVRATYRVGGQRYTAETASTVFLEPPPLSGEHAVSDLPWTGESNGWGPVERDQSNGENGAGDGQALTIRGRSWAKGVGMHAPGSLTTWLGGSCSGFAATVGIDDEVLAKSDYDGSDSVRFRVLGDGRLLAETPVVSSSGGPVALSADVTGVRRLTLQVDEATNGKNFDHADWADARVVCTG